MDRRVSTEQRLGFADLEVELADTELSSLDSMIDWGCIAELLSSVRGDYDPLSLFKMLLLQIWHDLSDESIARALRRDWVFMRFGGFTLAGSKPDSSTLCRFRKRLVNAAQLETLLRQINHCLSARGLKIANGKYFSSDATLIKSARRPRRVIDSRQGAVEVSYSDDHEATWIQKGDQRVYGYSASVTTDEAGLIESVTTFPANRSEMTRLKEVIDQLNPIPGQVLLYDKGADSDDNRAILKSQGIKDGIMRKKPKGKPMTRWNRLRNRLIRQRRFVVERTFGTLKRTYGLHRAGYVGLLQTQAEVLMKSIAYNLKRGINNHFNSQCTQCQCV